MKYALSLKAFSLTLLLSALVWAQEALPAQPSTEEVIGMVQALVEAAKGGHWALAVSLGVMILVWALRKFFWKSIPGKLIPWVSAGVGVILAVTMSIQDGSDIMGALSAGLLTGTAASGLWSLVGKHLLGGSSAKDG